MVSATDLKVYQSTNRLGGVITGTQVVNGGTNNLFSNVNRTQQVGGEDFFKCVYFKNTHATESMDNFKLWLTSKKPPNDTEIKWARDPVAKRSTGFDGVDDYVECGNDVALWSKSLTKFSFSLWIWPTAGWDTNSRSVVGHGGGSPQGFECLVDSTVANRIRFFVRNAAGTSFNATNNGLDLNRFNHVVCVYDNSLGAANIKIYVDTIIGTSNNLTEAVNLSDNLRLAAPSNDFKGYMKDFKWWSNKALTQTEINDLYEGAETEPVPDYHLKLRSTTVEDEISGTKTATLTNGAYYNLDAIVSTSSFIETPDVEWRTLGAEPSEITFTKFKAGDYFPIWLWYHVEPNAIGRRDDSELFAFKFQVTQGGTGSTGGGGGDEGSGSGTGGNPPPTNTNYKIAFCGDWGCENETDDVIDLVKNGGYNYLVGVGDNAYASSSCWIDRFDSLRDSGKFQHSAYGNHEYEESGGTSPYKTFFGDNKTYYTFKYQNIFFMVIDSNIDMDSGGTQHTTIKNALLASLNDNTITWRVGIIHHPWFGSSSNHTYNAGGAVQAFHQLFQDNEVQFVISGHNHNWQRTKQVIYNSGSPTSPTVVASTSPYSATKKGIIHVVSGTGGHDSGSSLYGLGSQPSFQAYQNRTHNGVWEMVASNNAQTLTCSFVDRDGSKFDTFVFNQ